MSVFFSQLDGKTSHKIILTVRSANPLTYTFPFNTNALSETGGEQWQTYQRDDVIRW